jgi:hypothetical protein
VSFKETSFMQNIKNIVALILALLVLVTIIGIAFLGFIALLALASIVAISFYVQGLLQGKRKDRVFNDLKANDSENVTIIEGEVINKTES